MSANKYVGCLAFALVGTLIVLSNLLAQDTTPVGKIPAVSSGATPAGSDGNIQTKSGTSLAAYAGSSCSAGQMVTDVSASGAFTCSALNVPVITLKTADESVTSSTAFQSDDTFVVAVGTNQKWIIEYNLITTGSSAGDIKACVTVPASATGWWLGNAKPVSSIASNFGDNDYYAETDLSDTCQLSVGLNTSTAMSAQLQAVVTTAGSSGNVTLRWAQLSSNATASVVKSGSWMRATRIG